MFSRSGVRAGYSGEEFSCVPDVSAAVLSDSICVSVSAGGAAGPLQAVRPPAGRIQNSTAIMILFIRVFRYFI